MTYVNRYYKENISEIWAVLYLAFSKGDNIIGNVDSEKVKYISERFGLAARIGAKIKVSQFPVSSDLKDFFYKKYKETLKSNLIALQLCSRILEISEEKKIPVVFLKGTSLLLDQKAEIGSRNLADVDILVPSEKAKIFYDYLKDKGFSSEMKDENGSNHLSPLTSSFGVLEVHKKIPFLLLKNEKEYLDFEKIKELKGIRKIEYEGKDFLILSFPLMLAHLLVHSFYQHYYFPDYYNPFQIFADFQDLKISKRDLEETLDIIYKKFNFPVKRNFIFNFYELYCFLEKGNNLHIDSLSKEGAGIFFHLINGCLDKRYVYSLRLRGIKNKYFYMNGLSKNILFVKDLILMVLREFYNRKNPFIIFSYLFKFFKFVWLKISLWCKIY